MARLANGKEEVVGVTEPVVIEIEGRNTLEEAFILGDEILIGQTALKKTDLLVDCVRQRVIPSPANPNQPVLKIRRKLLT